MGEGRDKKQYMPKNKMETTSLERCELILLRLHCIHHGCDGRLRSCEETLRKDPNRSTEGFPVLLALRAAQEKGLRLGKAKPGGRCRLQRYGHTSTLHQHKKV